MAAAQPASSAMPKPVSRSLAECITKVARAGQSSVLGEQDRSGARGTVGRDGAHHGQGCGGYDSDAGVSGAVDILAIGSEAGVTEIQARRGVVDGQRLGADGMQMACAGVRGGYIDRLSVRRCGQV